MVLQRAGEALDVVPEQEALDERAPVLGLGVQPPTSDWGEMLASGRAQLPHGWWLEVFPGLMITLTVLAVNLLGDGLRDALDPRATR